MFEGVKTLKLLLLSYIVLLVLDIFWLGYLMRRFYIKNFALFTRTEKGIRFHRGGIFVSWIVLLFGQYFFVMPTIAQSNVWITVGYGAIYGFITYGMYNFTNYATIDGYLLSMTLLDLVWGVFLNSTIAAVLFYSSKFLT